MNGLENSFDDVGVIVLTVIVALIVYVTIKILMFMKIWKATEDLEDIKIEINEINLKLESLHGNSKESNSQHDL